MKERLKKFFKRGTFSKNKKAYDMFVKKNWNNVVCKDCYVAFVNGKFVSIGKKRGELVKEIYNRFGNVPMYVGRADGGFNQVTIEEVEKE